MPTVTLTRPSATLEEIAAGLREQLGDRYQVAPKGGSTDVLRVSAGTMALASVRVVRAAGVTTCRVHGGGLIIGRLINELSIARTVAAALRKAPGVGA
jgi:hypothetical protein